MIYPTNRTAWAFRLLCPALVAIGFTFGGEARAQRVDVPVQTQIVNSLLSKAWSDQKLTHAKRSSDHEFMRRLFLDVLGRIPTPEEIKQFVSDGGANKRANLIRRILTKDTHEIKGVGEKGKPVVFEYTREYAEHWADIWTVWTMTRGGTHELYHNQMKMWLEKQFLNEQFAYDQFVRDLLTASGPGNKVGAVNFTMAHLGEANPPDRQITDGPFDAIPITSRVTRLFLGVQTQCTQCHDHPFNPEWGQENFWGVNAFYRSTTRDRTPAAPAGTGKKKGVDALPVAVTDDPALNSGLRIYYERRSGVLMSIKPTFLPNLSDLEKEKGERVKKPIPTSGAKSRRQFLADYVISHDNFAKAYVNRMWAHFFGRGLNEQAVPDDFGGHNKLIHPEMLEQLGQEFIKYKYDPKQLIEWICNSEAYNQSYVAATKEMAKADHDAFFVRMPLKALSPEVLHNALSTAVRADNAVDKEARKASREAWMRKLVNNFGDDEGNEITFNGTIVQGLLMMNGKELNDEIKRPDGVVAKLMARGSGNVIDEIYLTALGRPLSTMTQNFERIDPRTKKKTSYSDSERGIVMRAAASSGGGKAFYEDLFWSLLNTNEFMLNH